MLIGMSQETLAHNLGITFQQIQKYERGINRIGAGRLYELATVLDVNVQFFFSGPEFDNAGEAEATELSNDALTFLQSREGVELVRAVSRIDNQKLRVCILELARQLANDDTPVTSDVYEPGVEERKHAIG